MLLLTTNNTMVKLFAIFGLFLASASAFSPLRSLSPARLVRQQYKVTLKGPDGNTQDIECAPDVFMLDAAEAQGVNLSFDCRLGSCVACAGKVLEGTTDDSQQFFLTDELINMGFILTCASYPTVGGRLLACLLACLVSDRMLIVVTFANFHAINKQTMYE